MEQKKQDLTVEEQTGPATGEEVGNVQDVDNLASGETAEAATGNEEAAQTASDAAGDGDLAVKDREIEQWKQKADEHYQRYLRAQADFDNFRRRSRQEREDYVKYASSGVIEKLLPILDNFERAVAASRDHQEMESLIKGLDMVHTQFKQWMEQEGLQPIETVNQPFNPEFHQAIMQVDSEEHDEGMVVEEVQKGYVLKGKVIRPAMVKVST